MGISYLPFVKRWKKLLRLEDWDVELSVLSKEEYEASEVEAGIDAGCSNGWCEPMAFCKKAIIKMKQDGEHPDYTLVHELAHIWDTDSNDLVTKIIDHVSNTELQEEYAAAYREVMEARNHAVTRALLNVYENGAKK